MSSSAIYSAEALSPSLCMYPLALGALGGYSLVHIVVPPMRLQTSSAPWVLSLAPSLGTLCSVQWMAVSIYFCICQALAEPLRRQLYQASVSKLLLASTMVSGLVIVYEEVFII